MATSTRPDGAHPASGARSAGFWQGEDDEIGHLVHKPGGAWAFHYDIHGDQDDDETGYRFASHAFAPGEYVSIREHDDTLQTFRVVAVQELA